MAKKTKLHSKNPKYWNKTQDDTPIIKEVCNEEHSKNSCGFCGEDLDHKGYYCSKDCAKADNTEGI